MHNTIKNHIVRVKEWKCSESSTRAALHFRKNIQRHCTITIFEVEHLQNHICLLEWVAASKITCKIKIKKC